MCAPRVSVCANRILPKYCFEIGLPALGELVFDAEKREDLNGWLESLGHAPLLSPSTSSSSFGLSGQRKCAIFFFFSSSSSSLAPEPLFLFCLVTEHLPPSWMDKILCVLATHLTNLH